ncbi:MAG: UvrB/UvrC motif-containing protein [Novosphingobium sp.]
MNTAIAKLERRMAAAAEVMDFEEARRLRDQINLIRGGATAEDAARADTSGLVRQKAGAMGIGTSRPKPAEPAGWKPPSKPNPHTSGRARRK